MKKAFFICATTLLAAGFAFADQDEVTPYHHSKEPIAFYKTSCTQKCAPEPECWMRGEPLNGQYGPAYNAPAVIDVCGRNLNWCSCSLPTAFYVKASFLYWYGGEEGLALASNGVLNSGTIYFATQTEKFYSSFDYKPGFKVGLGFVENHNWSGYAEYTWLRGNNVTSLSTPTNGTIAGTTTPTSGTPVLLVDDWFLSGTAAGQALPGNSLTSKWGYAVDLLDVSVSRPYYEGPHLTINPFGGLRAAWIRQKMILSLTETPGIFSTLSAQPIGSRNYSRSWAIGPRFGADGSWLFCRGFRVEGDMAASLLYTRYTKVSHSEDPGSTAFNPGPYKTSLNSYGCLRPMAEFALGFGWGRYFNGKNYHIDFSASYDFTYMWNQNMIRKLLDDTLQGTSSASGDLYFHGLNLTGRFDF